MAIIDVLYVFESTKFTTSGKVESVMLVSGANAGPIDGTQVVLEPGIYRVTNAATLLPKSGTTFEVSTCDKGDGLPDPPGKIVKMFISSATYKTLTFAEMEAEIKAVLQGQGIEVTS